MNALANSLHLYIKSDLLYNAVQAFLVEQLRALWRVATQIKGVMLPVSGCDISPESSTHIVASRRHASFLFLSHNGLSHNELSPYKKGLE